MLHKAMLRPRSPLSVAGSRPGGRAGERVWSYEGRVVWAANSGHCQPVAPVQDVDLVGSQHPLPHSCNRGSQRQLLATKALRELTAAGDEALAPLNLQSCLFSATSADLARFAAGDRGGGGGGGGLGGEKEGFPRGSQGLAATGLPMIAREADGGVTYQDRDGVTGVYVERRGEEPAGHGIALVEDEEEGLSGEGGSDGRKDDTAHGGGEENDHAGCESRPEATRRDEGAEVIVGLLCKLVEDGAHSAVARMSRVLFSGPQRRRIQV